MAVTAEQSNSYLLSMEHITKIYANGFVANQDVSLSVKKGEIHALLGENGAGKSTLMKVLFGHEKLEEGRVFLDGKEISIDSPQTAIQYGIGMVHQHFMLVPSLTVAENLTLGIEPKRGGFYDIQAAVRMTEEISQKYNLNVDARAKVEDLPVGTKQKVEILKVLLRGAKIIILDEPTAVLTPQETKGLFEELVALKNDGYTIIFISHKLGEIKAICDRLTVLRAGKLVGVANVADLTEQQISQMMVGRDVVLKIDKEKAAPGEVVLDVRDLTLTAPNGKKQLDGVSLRVRAGQILGIAGVEGNGQKELSELVSGLAPIETGEILAAGEPVSGKSIRQIREMQIAHVPEDRMTYGSVATASISDNIISDRYYKKAFHKGLLLDRKKIKDEVRTLIHDFSVKCDGPEAQIKTLSGGNIQKVVAAREFSSSPRLILANQPTRGIDVGASEFIRRKLVQLRDAGAAILLISADLNEVLEVSDSLAVMCDGKVVAYFPDASVVGEDELGEYMLGLKRQSSREIEEKWKAESENPPTAI